MEERRITDEAIVEERREEMRGKGEGWQEKQ